MIMAIQKRRWMMAALLLGAALAGCLAAPIETVDPSLTGTWTGECAIDLPVVFDPSPLPDSVERTKAAAPVAITVHEDATVAGTVGEASIEESVLKQNRGDLGRSLNLASDYIVMDGYLSGPIVSGADENDAKAFTIPFNLVDGHVQGSLMWLQPSKYPFPLCRLDLQRNP